jgi:hypothetical protein
MGWGCKFLYMNFEYVFVGDDEGSKRVDVMYERAKKHEVRSLQVLVV